MFSGISFHSQDSQHQCVMKHFSTGCWTIKRPSPGNGLFKYVSSRVISHIRCCWTQFPCILAQFIMSTIIGCIYEDDFMTWNVFCISDPLYGKSTNTVSLIKIQPLFWAGLYQWVSARNIYTPLLTRCSYVFLALTYRYKIYWSQVSKCIHLASRIARTCENYLRVSYR